MTSKTTNGPLFPCQDELLALFEALINVIFCAKDRNGRYVEVNAAFVRRTGKKSKREVIGTTAADHFTAELSQRYEEQDALIFETGEPIGDELELIRRSNGQLGWYLTTKRPVMDPSGSGDIIGVVTASRDLDAPSEENVALERLQAVVQYVRDNIADHIRLGDLATAAQCSESQLDRRMRKVFGQSPTQYILRVRVEHAAKLLRETDTAISTIATSCGFYDQPDFTRRFARLTNATPAQFRIQHRR